eukprot:scaffold22610_cov115-Cylindrotheca_fusiformis.AAC.4
MRRFLLFSCFLLQVGSSLCFVVGSTSKNRLSNGVRLQASRAAQKKASRNNWLETRGIAVSGGGADDDIMVLFSPCKINLFLRIIRKREDGFHDLASLFQAVGFGDTLKLTKLEDGAGQDQFTCNMKGVPTDMTNLVLRALELMREKTGVAQYFKANLIKQVPAQAGLGGGSANAATAMWGANELMGSPASLEDVRNSYDGGSPNFLLAQGTAYCTGRGEVMSPTDPLLQAGTKVCIVKPNVGLSTPSVFKALDYDELSTLDADEVLLPEFLKAENVDDVSDEYYVNDLEAPAFRCVPVLGELKDKLKQVEGFKHVMMSGSGTSIFCIGEPSDPEQFQKDFGEDPELLVFFTEFINREESTWFQQP